jgi:predicted Fe-Mo cluster-binding NifX family protein
MKIAVPTNDGVSISRHFGRSAAFLVFDVQEKLIKSRESRSNAGCHSHTADHSHGEACGHGEHSHGGILAALADCEMVICSGIGDGARQALDARGVRTILVEGGPAEDTVAAWLAGTLAEASGSSCNCHR